MGMFLTEDVLQNGPVFRAPTHTSRHFILESHALRCVVSSSVLLFYGRILPDPINGFSVFSVPAG